MTNPRLGVAYGFYAGRWIGYSTSQLFELLKSQFATQNIDIQKIGLLDTAVHIRDNQLDIIDVITNSSLSNLAGLYFANWRKHPEFALASAEFMKRQGKPIISEEVLGVMPMSKLGEMVLLSDKNIPLPNSIFMRNKHWLKYLKKGGKLPFGDQAIVKSISGSMGADNYLVRSPDEFRQLLKRDLDMLFVVQEFIPNTCDYRIIFIGNEAKIAIKRSRVDEDTHVNNTSKGASAELIPLDQIPAEMIEIAKNAAHAVRRNTYCGVDIMQHQDTGAYYVLEVNKTPQMETGSNTNEKITALTDYFAKKLGEEL